MSTKSAARVATCVLWLAHAVCYNYKNTKSTTEAITTHTWPKPRNVLVARVVHWCAPMPALRFIGLLKNKKNTSTFKINNERRSEIDEGQ